ncbi:MAG: chaperone modulator CbpM [Kaistella sp.]
MEVNLPGVEIIHHLLQKMERLKDENRRLTQLYSDIKP